MHLPSYNPVRHDGWTGAQAHNPGVKEPSNPGARDPQIIYMMGQWERINMALADSHVLKSYGERFIPRLPGEDEDGYKARVMRFVHVPWFEELTGLAANKIFRKTLNFSTDEESLLEWAKDVDGTGTSLDDFFQQATLIAIQYGHCHILVDQSTDNQPVTLRDQIESEVTPNLFLIRPDQVAGFRTEFKYGRERLTQFRYYEYAQKPDGKYGSEWVQRVRVLEPGKYELFEQPEGGRNSWDLIESGTFDLDEVPITTVYGLKTQSMMSRPPMLEVANINLLYDQALCDHSHQMAVAATPILVLKGFDEQQPELTVSVNRALAMPPDGDVSYVQTDSASFQAQQNYLDYLTERMNQVAIVQLKDQKAAAETAQSKRLDSSDEDSFLSVISSTVESAVKQAIGWVQEYMGIDVEFEVVIPDNLSDQTLEPEQVAQLLALQASGAITKETLLEALVQGEILNVDPLEEAEAASQESMDDLMTNQEIMQSFATEPSGDQQSPAQ